MFRRQIFELIDIIFLVVLITGGAGQNTAELFLSSEGTSCTLSALPENRRDHTVDNHILCGGAGSAKSKSCLLWSPDSGTWDDWGGELDAVYAEYRYSHVSWTPSAESGTYLIGGLGNAAKMTTTLVKRDGTQEQGLPLEYVTE